jgi:hypothetical protein
MIAKSRTYSMCWRYYAIRREPQNIDYLLASGRSVRARSGAGGRVNRAASLLLWELVERCAVRFEKSPYRAGLSSI